MHKQNPDDERNGLPHHQSDGHRLLNPFKAGMQFIRTHYEQIYWSRLINCKCSMQSEWGDDQVPQDTSFAA
jgi:hypothetical protein